MHPSLALHGGKELPGPGPETRTKVSSTCPRHVGIATWPWSCGTGFPSGRTPWTWATTVGVSCTAGQKVSRWTLLPSDPAVFETAWSWVTGLLWLSWLWRESTRSEQGTTVPASWSNPTLRLDKWFSIMETAHFSLHLVLTPTLSSERGSQLRYVSGRKEMREALAGDRCALELWQGWQNDLQRALRRDGHRVMRCTTLFPSRGHPQQSWAVNVRTASSRTS